MVRRPCLVFSNFSKLHFTGGGRPGGAREGVPEGVPEGSPDRASGGHLTGL